MLTKDKILEIARQKGRLVTKEIAEAFQVSRQYASGLIKELVDENKLVRIGVRRNAFYVLPGKENKFSNSTSFRYEKMFVNHSLKEHEVMDSIENRFIPIRNLPENVKSVFEYAFSEMLNNAIEHSESKLITVEVSIVNGVLTFTINDSGIGVFNNVMRKRNLKSPFEAMQDILKGKTTTMPKSHSGEGIFFTSKVGDLFILDSFGYQLIANNDLPDIFFKQSKKIKRGTKVIFKINVNSSHHVSDVFREYTNIGAESDHGFDKTKVKVKLYTLGGIHVSRSQARRILSGLEKFKIIIFDFDKVPMVGQAFADEIYRVFHHKYPKILLKETHMDEGVKFMIERAKTEAKKDNQK